MTALTVTCIHRAMSIVPKALCKKENPIWQCRPHHLKAMCVKCRQAHKRLASLNLQREIIFWRVLMQSCRIRMMRWVRRTNLACFLTRCWECFRLHEFNKNFLIGKPWKKTWLLTSAQHRLKDLKINKTNAMLIKMAGSLARLNNPRSKAAKALSNYLWVPLPSSAKKTCPKLCQIKRCH